MPMPDPIKAVITFFSSDFKVRQGQNDQWRRHRDETSGTVKGDKPKYNLLKKIIPFIRWDGLTQTHPPMSSYDRSTTGRTPRNSPDKVKLDAATDREERQGLLTRNNDEEEQHESKQNTSGRGRFEPGAVSDSRTSSRTSSRSSTPEPYQR